MTDHIQIKDITPRIQYLGDGNQTVFPYPFPIFASGDLEIYLDDALHNSGFTISGAGASGGGDVTFTGAPANNVRVTLRRRIAIQRTSDFQEGGAFRAKVINDELDYQTAALQQVADDAGRAVVRAPTSASTADLTLPEPAAGRALKWNAGGDGLENSALDADTLADAAAASAAAATASAGTASTQAGLAAAAKAAAEDAEAAAEAAALAADVAKIEWRGAWSNATAYAVNDAVAEAGTSYICIQAHTNQQPPNAAYWDVLAAKGATGPTGATGATGATGPQGPQGDPGTGTGDLLAANNLADVANAANAFGNIKQAATEGASGVAEIATQAEVNAGTDDARFVTPLKLATRLADLSAEDSWARNNLMLNWLGDEIAHTVAMGTMQDGAHDAFESDTIGSNSTSETYDATGDYYHNPTQSMVSAGTGTAVGDCTASGGLAAAFDGNTSVPYASSARKSGTNASGYVGKDWGSGNTKTLSGVKLYGATDYGFFGGGSATTLQYTVKGSNSTPSLGGGTAIYTSSSGIAGGASTIITQLSGFNTSTAYRYHWVEITPNAADGNITFAEIEFYEQTAAADMTLISNAATAQAAPTDARIVVLHDPVDSVTPNTDVKAYASRDGGTSWTQITLTNEGAWDANYNILAGTADISGQPSGTSMKWKITTHNNKEQRVKAVALAWGQNTMSTETYREKQARLAQAGSVDLKRRVAYDAEGVTDPVRLDALWDLAVGKPGAQARVNALESKRDAVKTRHPKP